MNKLISIILPTFNGGKYIKRAIDSVLEQSFINWELLIIDDGSTDNIKDITNEYIKKDRRIIYLKNEVNLGIQKTLNKGLREARGEYIARIDDDDIWCDKDKLKKQIEFLDKNKDYVLVGTGVVIIDEKGNEIMRYLFPNTDKDIRKKILSKNCFVHSSVLFRKSNILNIGGYSESKSFLHVEDYDLWLRIGIIGKFANLPTYSVKFTLRNDSISSKNKKEQFRKNLDLIINHKKEYSNFIISIFKSHVRILAYIFLFKILNQHLLKKIMKIYKERW